MLSSSLASTHSDDHLGKKPQVTWDRADDPRNPQTWSLRCKFLVTGILVLATLNTTFGSSTAVSVVQAIKDDFSISSNISNVLTVVYMLGYVFGPSFWAPGSEYFGRRPVFILALLAYTICCHCQASAPNMWFFMLARFLAGFFAVAPLTISGGVIADIWCVSGRGHSTTITTGAAFLGLSIGQIVSGCVVDCGWLSWRWVFWIMMIISFFTSVLSILYFPETYGPVLLQKYKRYHESDTLMHAAYEWEDWSWSGPQNHILYRPFEMFVTEPILVNITVYMSIIYGVFYCLLDTNTFKMNSTMFIGIGIGTILGTVINFYVNWHYPELVLQWSGHPPPEERLYGAMIGGPGLTFSVFWLGGTEFFPWYILATSSILLGMSITLILTSFMSYLVDTYQHYCASAYAVNTIIRSAFTVTLSIFTIESFTKIGINRTCTMLSLISLLLSPYPFLLHRFGKIIRKESKYVPWNDLFQTPTICKL